MVKKLLCFLLILCFVLFLSNIAYAADILMDLNTSTNSVDATNEVIDDTITNVDTTEPIIEYETTTSTTDYEDPGELSITNMINIILIVVGVVLILLGIAIIIKLK